MKIEKMKSQLQMNNLYFSECNIKSSDLIQNGELDPDLIINITKVESPVYDVKLSFSINKSDVDILIVAHARFKYEADDYSNEDSIINNNTVAIMFPFIRSQVTLLTSQPNITPIILPPINTKIFS